MGQDRMMKLVAKGLAKWHLLPIRTAESRELPSLWIQLEKFIKNCWFADMKHWHLFVVPMDLEERSKSISLRLIQDYVSAKPILSHSFTGFHRLLRASLNA
jgi:hypothetical protein